MILKKQTGLAWWLAEVSRVIRHNIWHKGTSSNFCFQSREFLDSQDSINIVTDIYTFCILNQNLGLTPFESTSKITLVRNENCSFACDFVILNQMTRYPGHHCWRMVWFLKRVPGEDCFAALSTYLLLGNSQSKPKGPELQKYQHRCVNAIFDIDELRL